MDKLSTENKQYFNAFYHDNSLLLQFVITHFIKTHPHIIELHQYVENTLSSPHAHDISSDVFFKILRLLIGNLSTETQQSLPLWTKGLLTKLKEYAEQLSCNSQHKDKGYINLHIALHQAWLAAVNALELLTTLTQLETLSKKKTVLIRTLRRNFLSLHRSYLQALGYLANSCKRQLRNENILLCLLKSQSLLSQMYGDDFIYKKLKCPYSPENILKVLSNKFRSRGFDGLPVKIEVAQRGISSL